MAQERATPTLGQQARCVGRLLCLRRPIVEALPTGPLPGLVAGVLAAVLWIAFDAYLNRPHGAFDPYGFIDLAWFVLGALGIAGVMQLGSRMRINYGYALTLVGLTSPALVLAWLHWGQVAYTETRSLDTLTLLGVGAPLAYASLLWLRGLIAPARRTALASWLWSSIAVLAFGATSTQLGAQPAFWYGAETPNGPPSDPLLPRASALLFEQPARIDAALRKLPAARIVDAPRAYFLGFAGVGEQRVFANEIGTARRVLERRFDFGPRALSLLNDRRDLETAPLASVQSLRYALQQLGARMHRDKDVLVLALSSHGGADATLEVSNGTLPFEALSATALADALAKSGIRWRVIIISACHAGAFIPALKNEHTIIVAAAAPDRSSFGCADDRDLTYFGEAFYRDALPHAASLRAAFETARRTVAVRERAEGFAASNPTAWFGAEMEAHLARVMRAPL